MSPKSVFALLFILPLWMICSGCSSSSSRFDPPSESLKETRLPGKIISVTTSGVVPRSSLQIPENGVIYFYNETSEQISVEFRLPQEGVTNGETTQGFQIDQQTAFTPDLIAPGTLATISFNQVGNYVYVIHGLNQPLRGEIEVQRSF